MNRPVDIFDQIAVNAVAKVAAPVVGSFREFLEKHARVKISSGNYGPYTFAGREALEFVVGVIDRVLGSASSARRGGPLRPPSATPGHGQAQGPAPTISDARLTATGSAQWGKPSATPAARDAAMSLSRQTIHDGPISDARLTATGSAQWGKTILELNLLAYLAGLEFRSVGLFLPDEDLVEGVVDSKFRPDVLDQLPWLNSLITLGKAENASGKTVNRKGLFTVTDGKRKSHGMVHGMRKIPTTFSFDVVIEDEKDDIPPSMSRYLTARMTASDLRFRLSIGTQRYAGAGQNKEFESGTMHVGHFTCPACGHKQNPEENWPQVCRLAVDGEAKADDPQLQLEGNFRKALGSAGVSPAVVVGGRPSVTAATGTHSTGSGQAVALPTTTGTTATGTVALPGIYEFEPDAHFYLACVRCGAKLDRHAPEFIPQHPEREKLHHWSVRISQLLVAAISLKQIVADWCNNAVKDPDAMKTFYVDRLGLPRSATQQIDQKILDRARSVETFDLSLTARPGTVRYAGLDTGDRCWLTVREVEMAGANDRNRDPFDGLRTGGRATNDIGNDRNRDGRATGFPVKRIVWMEQLSAERVRSRVPQIFETMGIATLFVDAGPLRDLARDLCFLLNGLNGADARQRVPTSDAERAVIHFPGGLVWDGKNQQWRGLRCAAVEFSLKAGKGIQHKLGITQDGLLYPIIACNRDETIERVVNELLTANEGVIEAITTTASRDACATNDTGNDRNRDGRATRLRTEPAIRLPARGVGAPKIVETFDAHVIAGSRRDRDADGNAEHFVDGCENHFLLSNAYSALAESIGEHAVAPSTGAMDPDTAVTIEPALRARSLAARRTLW